MASFASSVIDSARDARNARRRLAARLAVVRLSCWPARARAEVPARLAVCGKQMSAASGVGEQRKKALGAERVHLTLDILSRSFQLRRRPPQSPQRASEAMLDPDWAGRSWGRQELPSPRHFASALQNKRRV